MPIDYKRIKQFLDKTTVRRAIAEVVRRAGFEIVWVEEIERRPELWGIYLKLSHPLRDLLDTA
jgi:hypothetical protein